MIAQEEKLSNFTGEITKKIKGILTEENKSQTNDKQQDTIRFLDCKIPALKTGIYQLTALQSITVSGKTEQTGRLEKDFVVEGPRFSIPDEMIKSIFPPQGTTGDYNAVLPHLSFNRATLPWELEMDSKKPWFALVLFHADEAPEINRAFIQDLKDERDQAIAPAHYNNTKETVNLIRLTDDYLPKSPELQVHARHAESNGKVNESAFVFANRLPLNNGKNTVHLVSLRDRLPHQTYISLYYWEFESKKNRPDFTALLKGVSARPYRFYAGNKDNSLYENGYVALPHFLRLGFQTLSLYQSPLLPYELPDPEMEMMVGLRAFPKPKYQYERVEWKELSDGSKMADVSFAAAFHLGQMLTVANKQVSQSIFKWKRQLYQEQKSAFLEEKTGKKSPDVLRRERDHQLPESIKKWISDILTLNKIPFNYLVPCEAMLPPDSIRFFKLNKKWLKNCLDGMFTVGEEFFSFESEHVLYSGDYTGFILRSSVVGHYPEMEVRARENSFQVEMAEPFFVRRLSREVMICCFKAEIASAEIYLPTGAVHFGVEAEGDDVLIKAAGKGKENDKKRISGVLNREKSTISFDLLKEKLNCKSSADLAVRLLENSPKVVFEAESFSEEIPNKVVWEDS